MSDTMRRRSCVVSAVCMVACMLSNVPDADACSYGPGGAGVVWPPSMEDGAEVAVDTNVWLSLEGLSPGEIAFRVEDDDGVEVEVDTEIIGRTTDRGSPFGNWIVLDPVANLKPLTRYTITLTFPGFEGVSQSTERMFETSAGILAQPPPSMSETTYVAMEGVEDRGDDCDPDGSDAVHALRWKIAPTRGHFLSILRVQRVGEPERVSVRHFDAESSNFGPYMFNGDASVGLEEYPCLVHTLMDVVGREVSSKNVCEPDLCVVPPLTEYGTTDYNSSEYQAFIHNPGTWSSMSAACRMAAADARGDTDGCSMAPTSPTPRTPLALGALALLGLLRTKQSKRRHV